MMTATWWEKSALSVGMPRRNAEWSTESSCTSVAKWISSTTAARVTTRGSVAPTACWLRSSSIGRNSFPFIRSRWSLASAMMGKSAAMMRRSSAATWSSPAATGRWMSPRETRIVCSLISTHVGERFDPRPHVLEADVDGEHAAVQLACFRGLPLLLDRATQPVENAEALLVTRRRQLERASQNRFRHHRSAFLEEAHAQRLGRPQLPLGRPQRFLQLGDRFVQEAHFF